MTKNMRIAYCIENMLGHGGMEKIISQKASYLAEIFGHHVDILTAYGDAKDCPFPISQKVTTVNLGINFDYDKIKNRYKAWYFALDSHLHSNQYDIVISTGGKDLDFLYKIKDNSIKIAEFHFAFNTIKFWAKKDFPGLRGGIIGILKTARAIRNASKYEKFIVLSASDCKKWNRFLPNCIFIYNPIDIKHSDIKYDSNSRTVINIGRLDPIKGHDLLIKAWESVYRQHKDWELKIFGAGEKTKLQKLINNLHLGSAIKLMGHTDKVEAELLQASFFVLSSRVEGFGLVIAEAQACGLPVITFNTPVGPAEIVNNNIDGTIVDKVGDINGLSQAIIRMMESPQTRKEMSASAVKNSIRFQKDEIMEQWNHLFIQLINDKRHNIQA